MEARPARLFCNNIDGRNNLEERIKPYLIKRGPFDYLMFQEIFEPNFIQLKEQFGLKGAFGASCWKAFDLRGEERGEQLYRWGVAILSRDPIISVEELTYSDAGRTALPVFREWREGDGDLIENERRLLLHVKTQREGQEWDMVTTKFTWPPYVVMSHTQLTDLDRMRTHLNNLKSGFVFGLDANSRRGWPIYGALARNYKANVPKKVKSTLDPELHRRGDLERVVDEIFTTEEYRARVRTVQGLSDHIALIATVRKQSSLSPAA